ncbi:MAG: flagellar biosynthetic protein FliO [Lachnospiraceae bacterium]|nr:flagellar biosynthetic protein FliO [Lachnospiraceae bacterium]
MRIALTNNVSGWHSIASVISLLLIFVFIVVLAYFSTKFVAKYQSNIINRKSNIKIIESCRVGNNKFIAIIMIGKDYYAVALGKDEITFIDKLDEEGLKLNMQEASDDSDISDTSSGISSDKPDFKEILSQIKNKKSKDNDIK